MHYRPSRGKTSATHFGDFAKRISYLQSTEAFMLFCRRRIARVALSIRTTISIILCERSGAIITSVFDLQQPFTAHRIKPHSCALSCSLHRTSPSRRNGTTNSIGIIAQEFRQDFLKNARRQPVTSRSQIPNSPPLISFNTATSPEVCPASQP